MVGPLRNCHRALRNSKYKAAPGQTFFPHCVKFHGHENTQNIIKPLINQIEAIEQMKRPESKKDVMKLFRALNYSSKYFPNMHVSWLHSITYFTMIFLLIGKKNLKVFLI